MGAFGSRLGGSCAASDPAAHTPGTPIAPAVLAEDSRKTIKQAVTQPSSRRESERRTLRQNLVHERKHTAVWDNYEIVKEIGHGMTGKVYEVREDEAADISEGIGEGATHYCSATRSRRRRRS